MPKAALVDHEKLAELQQSRASLVEAEETLPRRVLDRRAADGEGVARGARAARRAAEGAEGERIRGEDQQAARREERRQREQLRVKAGNREQGNRGRAAMCSSALFVNATANPHPCAKARMSGATRLRTLEVAAAFEGAGEGDFVGVLDVGAGGNPVAMRAMRRVGAMRRTSGGEVGGGGFALGGGGCRRG